MSRFSTLVTCSRVPRFGVLPPSLCRGPACCARKGATANIANFASRQALARTCGFALLGWKVRVAAGRGSITHVIILYKYWNVNLKNSSSVGRNNLAFPRNYAALYSFRGAGASRVQGPFDAETPSGGRARRRLAAHSRTASAMRIFSGHASAVLSLCHAAWRSRSLRVSVIQKPRLEPRPCIRQSMPCG